MKFKILTILCLFLFVTTILFCSLWQYQKSKQTDLLQMCNVGISDALRAFSEYSDNADEAAYIQGISAYNIFVKASFLLDENSVQRKHATFANEVYSVLLTNPSASKKYINEIISMLTMLSKDMNNRDAYRIMLDLRNIK